MIIFLDLETTGLRPHHDVILEVAAIEVRGPALEVVRGFHSVIKPAVPPEMLMDAYVRNMHTVNGLLAELPAAPTSGEVWPALAEWLGEGVHTLAGDSVHFDRGFLLAHASNVAEKFSHRLLDVSALRIARTVKGLIPCPIVGTHTHRAADDVQASVAAARWLIGEMT